MKIDVVIFCNYNPKIMLWKLLNKNMKVKHIISDIYDKISSFISLKHIVIVNSIESSENILESSCISKWINCCRVVLDNVFEKNSSASKFYESYFGSKIKRCAFLLYKEILYNAINLFDRGGMIS